MTTKVFLRCSLLLTLSLTLFAQGTRPPAPGGGGAGGGTGTPTVPTRPTLPTNVPNNTPSNIPELTQRPTYISGKVMLDDGTPPPDPVVLQLVCRSSPRNIGYTDSKGSFSVDLNDRLHSAVYADASQTGSYGMNNTGGSGMSSNSSGRQSNGLGDNAFMGCDIQASLPGFRSDVVHLESRRSMDNPEIGAIILHRLANVEGLTISATSSLAPKDARKAFEKGRSELQKKKFDVAQRELEKAVQIYPKYAAAWFTLGTVQEEQKDPEAARKSFAQSLAADSKYVNPYLELASMAMREQKWKEAADDTDRLLRLNPVDFPQAWFFNALANYYLRKLDLVETSAREGLSRDTAHHFPKLSQLLAIALAQKQDYAGAAQNMRDYLRFAPNATDSEAVKKQLAELEKHVGPEAQKQ